MVRISVSGRAADPETVTQQEFPEFVRTQEQIEPIRWVWSDTTLFYPVLLAAGVRITRCHDLRLCHQILKYSALVADSATSPVSRRWEVPSDTPRHDPTQAPTLFDIPSFPPSAILPSSLDDILAEFTLQRGAISTSAAPGRLSLLLAAESAGALIAAELSAAGLPWDAAEHERILEEALGPRPPHGSKPARMVALAQEIQHALRAPALPIDSPPQLLRALRAADVDVSSTSRWELAEHEHPAIPPLLKYKKLARLLSANGWGWLDEWVQDGRYRPVYIPGGVVTGRWASSGGGALQLPRQLRPALRADPGWLLVSADVSQLEPRVLAAMAHDSAMAAAGRGRDLYQGIVDVGSVETREQAKFAMLGAMYGATTGESGRLVPRLRRVFPQAMALVDRAAEIGTQGERVSTWLGRSSPPPEAAWNLAQARATLPGASRGDEELARRVARERGRFTRNFVVQGTAAEWALAWLAEIRLRLAKFPELTSGSLARASGPCFERQAHLAFFLHDEVIVHAPAGQAEAAAAVITEAAAAAGKLLFGEFEVDFRLDTQISERAHKS